MKSQLSSMAARMLLLFCGLSLFIVFLGFNYSPPRSILESFYPGDAQTTATRFKNSWRQRGSCLPAWVCALYPSPWYQALLAFFLL